MCPCAVFVEIGKGSWDLGDADGIQARPAEGDRSAVQLNLPPRSRLLDAVRFGSRVAVLSGFYR
jgi:hypothetical protein